MFQAHYYLVSLADSRAVLQTLQYDCSALLGILCKIAQFIELLLTYLMSYRAPNDVLDDININFVLERLMLEFSDAKDLSKI